MMTAASELATQAAANAAFSFSTSTILAAAAVVLATSSAASSQSIVNAVPVIAETNVNVAVPAVVTAVTETVPACLTGVVVWIGSSTLVILSNARLPAFDVVPVIVISSLIALPPRVPLIFTFVVIADDALTFTFLAASGDVTSVIVCTADVNGVSAKQPLSLSAVAEAAGMTTSVTTPSFCGSCGSPTSTFTRLYSKKLRVSIIYTSLFTDE